MLHTWQVILYIAGLIALFLAAIGVVVNRVSLVIIGAMLLVLGFVLPVLVK